MLSRSPSQISLDSSPKSLDEAAGHLISTPSYPDDQSQKMVQGVPEEVAADLPAEKDVMEQEAVAEKPIVEPEALADKPVVEPEALANIPSYAELDADDIPAAQPDKELSLES